MRNRKLRTDSELQVRYGLPLIYGLIESAQCLPLCHMI